MAAYLSRTYASAGNRKTFTISTWLKITNLSNAQSIFYGDTAGNTNGTNDDFYYNGNNKIYYGGYNSTYINSTALFKDVAAWYHIVLSVDTTQATSSNRIKFYVNGVEQARTEGAGYPAQNFDTAFIKSGTFQICGNSPASGYGLHNLASFYYIDGQQLTPSSFGQTDSTTGIWKPLSYSGTYGTNGFYLKFANSASLGTDSSGNGNNFTVNGTPTQTLDTPSNVFATMNNLNVNPSATATFANGNNAVTVNAVDVDIPSTIGVNKGKWYWEVKWTADGGFDRFGICPDDASQTVAPTVTGIGWDRLSTSNGMYMLNSAVSGSWGSAFSTGDVINFALDCDNTALYIGQNGTWRNSGVPTSGSSRTGAVNYSANSLNGKYLFPAFGKGGAGTSTWQTNFGNGYFATTAISSPYADGAGFGKFQYPPPTGYYALCTKNINTYG
jgi:hypothetical protein